MVADQSQGRPPPTDDEVRSALLRFGELVRRLEDDGSLLRSLPLILGRLGDLRRLIFEYEVRVTERLLPVEDAAERESRWIVREAIEREEDASDEWKDGWTPDGSDETGGVL